MVTMYFPGCRCVRGKLYFPCTSLTTDTVKLAPSRRALTTTPSIGPSSCELTTPPRAAGPDACALRPPGAELVTPIARAVAAIIRSALGRIDSPQDERDSRPAAYSSRMICRAGLL